MAQNQSAEVSPALSAPVGQLMRQTLTCGSEESVARAVVELRRNGGGILPITEYDQLVGVVTEASLARALGDGVDLQAPCTDAMSQAYRIAPYASGAEALRLLSEMDLPTLVVADDVERVMGLLSPSDLFPRRRQAPRPSPVGGMATPFGVYLTSGGISGGVSQFAIIGTGALMFSMLVISTLIVTYASGPIDHSTLPVWMKAVIESVSALALFLLMMRLAPLSGTHGAEHMVVHAIERGEDLTPEIVSRMPRVHPRCGTNLAVAMSVFLAIFESHWVEDDSVRLLVAALVTMYLWRPMGSFVQQYITTKKPTERQLRSGIKAGTDLIEKYSTTRFSSASIPARFWNSGLLQVMSGSMLVYLALKGAMWLFHFSLPID